MLQYCSSEKKKSVKLLKIALLGLYLGKNRASMSHAQNQVIIHQIKMVKLVLENLKNIYCSSY